MIRFCKWVAWLFRHRHQWNAYRREYRQEDPEVGLFHHTTFFCRQCHCGADEVQSAGPSGDGKWRPTSKPFTHRWERDQWAASKIRAS